MSSPITKETNPNKVSSVAKEHGIKKKKTLQKQRKNVVAESAGLDRSLHLVTESPFLSCGLGEG